MSINLRKEKLYLKDAKTVQIKVGNRIKSFNYQNKILDVIKVLKTEPRILVRLNKDHQCFFCSNEVEVIS